MFERRAVLLMIIIAMGPGARATSLNSRTSVGQNTFIEDISVDTGLGEKEEWTLSAGATTLRTKTPDTTDTTNAVNFGAAYMDERAGVDFGGEFRKTPEENLTSSSFSLGGSLRSEMFQVRLSGGTTTFTETYSGSRVTARGKTRPVSGSLSLRQEYVRVDLKYKPSRAWRLRVGVAGYGYDRNPQTFENRLNTPAAIRSGLGGFSSTVGGLPASTASVGVTWLFSEVWEVSFFQSWSRIAVDQSQSRVSRLQFGVDASDHWHFDFGAERDVSASLSDSLILAGVEYTF